MVKKIKSNSTIKRFGLTGIGHSNINTTMPVNGKAHGSLKRKGYYLLTTTTTSSTTTTTTA